MTLNGYNIVSSRLLDSHPRIQLREDCYSDEFKVDMNKWLAEFFGYTEECKDGICIGNTMHVSTRVYAQLKVEISK